MNWKIATPVLIVAAIVAGGLAAVFISGWSGLGGATTLDVSSVIKQIPEIRTFLDENPDAEINVVLWKSDYTESNTYKISEKCMPAIDFSSDYYRAELVDDSGTIIAWLTSDASEAVCILRKATAIKSLAVEPEPEAEPEPEPEEETSSDDPLLLVDQECDKGLLFLTIQNNREKDISTVERLTLLAVTDDEGEKVCSSRPFHLSDDFKCNSGCGETIKKGEEEKIVILLSRCEDFMAFRDYDYIIYFNDVNVTGTFRYKE